jgi:hypothetical protein
MNSSFHFCSKLLIPTSVLLASILTAPAFGQTLEDFKILPSDGGANQETGYATAIDGGIIVVGARQDDDSGAASGSVYLFDSATGAQLVKLLANDGASGDQFGFSVSLSNGIVAVGAPYDDDRGLDSGAVYLFDALTGVQLAKIVPNDGWAGDEFGFDVAIDGGTVAIGAKRDDDNGQDSGSLYLYDVASAALIVKVLPNDGAADDNFGEAVDLDQGVVSVGAHGDDDRGFLSGSAYLFDANTGAQLAKLLASDGSSNDFFGSAIAIDGGIVAVGAWSDSLFFDHSGSVYLFDAGTGIQTAKLVPADGDDRDHFGISIALDSGIVAIGADGDDDNAFNSGSAYLYDAGSGQMIRKLLSSDGEAHDEFGAAIAIDNGVVVIGAAGDDDQGASSGSAYVFSPFALSISGSPGGMMSFQIDGATPAGQVALLYAFGVGAHVVSNPLTGTAITTELSSSGFSVGIFDVADSEGDLVFTLNVPAGAAGQVWVQVVDGLSDGTSNVIGI